MHRQLLAENETFTALLDSVRLQFALRFMQEALARSPPYDESALAPLASAESVRQMIAALLGRGVARSRRWRKTSA